jgi:hypothetical protein
MGRRAADLTGQRFASLVVEGRTDTPSGARGVFWLCRCDCGAKTVKRGPWLFNGISKSCDACRLQRYASRHTTHGMSHTPTWNSWHAMLSRCTRPGDRSYSYYGGRGIRVCAEWESFETFLADMGERPEGGTIDRVDVNGDYCPENCRWATRKEQTANRRPAKDAKLEPHEYAQIRWLRNELGYKLRDIGDMFGVSDGHVCSVAKGLFGAS